MTFGNVSISRSEDIGIVRRPLPGDRLGSSLKSVYGEQPMLPDDMLRLLRSLDRPTRGGH